MDKWHIFMGRKVDRNIDDAKRYDFILVGLGDGNCQFHQWDYMIGVAQ
jgi:hypothetical protein